MSDSSSLQTVAFLDRLPKLPGEREFNKWSMLWTYTAFSAATWMLLIGALLPGTGNPFLGLASYAAGFVPGMVLVVLGAAIASAKYGIDTLDAVKATFGRRGYYLGLILSVGTLLMWGYLIMNMGSNSIASFVTTVDGSSSPLSDTWKGFFGLAILIACWLGAALGPHFFDRLNRFIAPGILILTVGTFAVLLIHFGAHTVFSTPVTEPFTTNHAVGFFYGFEFGFASALTYWPMMGAISRLSATQKEVVTPGIAGIALVGGSFVAITPCFASLVTGQTDPTLWLPAVLPSWLAVVGLFFVLAANVTSIIVIFYVLALQVSLLPGIRLLHRLVVTAFLALPGAYFAFRPTFLIDHVSTVLAYGGLVFCGISAVMVVDYFILRKQNLSLRDIFGATTEKNRYEFWFGVNVIAVAVVVGGYFLETWLMDPVSLVYHGPFKVVGASMPTALAVGVAYYVGMRLVAIPLRVGDYVKARTLTPEEAAPSDAVKEAA